MITLIWKELRENAKWALLLLLVVGSAEINAIYPRDLQEAINQGSYNGVTLLRPAFLTLTTFGSAGVGLVLGLLQILPELRRDRWAALLHRPVSRGVIFRGKVVAGLILYLFVTVPPFLTAIWLTATPGTFTTPFVPGMVQPGAADITAGLMYYFAALAMTLPRRGWVGLRVVPLLAAIYTSYFVLGQTFFHVAVEGAVLMAFALFVAAWGEILRQDSLGGRPWLAKAAFLAVAIYAACGLESLARSFIEALQPSRQGGSESYSFTKDAVPLHLFSDFNGVIVSVLGLDGKPPTDPDYQPSRVRNHVSEYNWVSQYVGDSHGYHGNGYRDKYRQMRNYFWGDSPYEFPRYEQWFNLKRQHYLIGFLPMKKQAFALLDQGGFEPATAVPKPFPPELSVENADTGVYCLWKPDSLRFAFLGERQIVDVALPAPGPIYGIGSAYSETGSGSISVTPVGLGSGIAVYDDNAALLTFLPYHHDVSRWGQISMGVNGTLDRFYVEYQPSVFLSGDVKKTMLSYIEEVNKQGQVLHAYTMPPLPPDRPSPPTWIGFLSQRAQSPAGYFGMMAYNKAGAVLFGSKRLAENFSKPFGASKIAETEEVSLDVIGLALILAILAWVLARRACFDRKSAWSWAAFVFAFGLPGFVAFALGADWPAFVPCPACRKPRPTEAPLCPHCEASWPAPAPTGIEIFDERPAAVIA